MKKKQNEVEVVAGIVAAIEEDDDAFDRRLQELDGGALGEGEHSGGKEQEEEQEEEEDHFDSSATPLPREGLATEGGRPGTSESNKISVDLDDSGDSDMDLSLNEDRIRRAAEARDGEFEPLGLANPASRTLERERGRRRGRRGHDSPSAKAGGKPVPKEVDARRIEYTLREPRKKH
jgi:hypothetical protein